MSKYNETLIDIPVEDAYEEVFGQAAAKYTEKYKPKKITAKDYFERQENAKTKNIAYEFSIQIGTVVSNSRRGSSVERDIIKDYAVGFEQRNLNTKVIGAYIHDDEEKKPTHIHLIVIPWGDGFSSGMPRQISFNGALKKNGFKTGSMQDEANWFGREYKALYQACEKHGIKMIRSENEWINLFGSPYLSEQRQWQYHMEELDKAKQKVEKPKPNSKTVYFNWSTIRSQEEIKKIRGNVGENSPINNEAPFDLTLENAYEKIFGCAAREYTWRHPESPRTAKDYLQGRMNAGATIALELTVQIGTIEETPHGEDSIERKTLKDYIIKFIRAHDAFEIMGAYIHCYEKGRAAHAHILFIP